MSPLHAFATRYPVVAYVLLCYLITWGIWSSIPLLTDGSWIEAKVWLGVGMGPGLAAVILDRLHGSAGAWGSRRWWMTFTVVGAIVIALNISSLLTGDGIDAARFLHSDPVGLSISGIAGSLLSAVTAGFVAASCAVSSRPTLRSILQWRVRPTLWLAALFIPAIFIFAGRLFELDGGTVQLLSVNGDTLPYVIRSVLFTLLVVSVGEEPGWRGWMLPALQNRLSPFTSSIILGLIWGFWHLPLFLIGIYDRPPEAILEYALIGPLLALLFTWLHNRSGGVLLLAIVLHTSLNNSDRIF